MNYKAFRYKAAVDFVELEVVFERATQAVHVSRIFGGSKPRLSVDSIDPQTNAPFPERAENTSATTFRVRVQDPTSYENLRRWIAAFRGRADQWGGPAVLDIDRITAVEVVFDLYAKPGKAGRDDLAQAVAHLYRGARTVTGQQNHRMFKAEGNTHAIPRTKQSLVRQIAEGWNIGIGNKHDEHYQHFYLKDTDTLVNRETGRGERRQLPDSKHRARFENRWRGAKLADVIGEHIIDLEVFKFADLAPHFNFRREDSEAQGMDLTLLEATRQIGERQPEGTVRRTRIGGVRRKIAIVNRPQTRADGHLNKHARDALGRLTKAWQKGQRTCGAT